MRLTLRTMLAYLDDMLEPEDAGQIAEKIEKSEFASDIVHRLRGAMQKLRLEAPALTGKEMGIDPNTVAEYLDYTLPDDRVPDFERFCLAQPATIKSEMHLAEVGSCHQILALVLQGPPEIGAGARERMYGLLQPLAPPQPVGVSLAAQLDEDHRPQPAPWVDERIKPEVPEELRDLRSSGRFWRIAAAVLLLCGVGMAGVMALQPEWAKKLLNRPTNNLASNSSSSSDEGANGDGRLIPNEPLPPAAEWNDDEDDKAADDSTDGLQQPADIAATDIPAEGEPTDDAEPAPVPEGEEELDEMEEMEVVEEDEPAAIAVEAPPAAVVDVPPVEVPAGETIARYVSAGSVLVRYNAKTNEWDRLPTQQALSPGQRVLTLPGFDATLALTNAVTLQLKGETEVELQGLDEAGLLSLKILHGRIVMSTVGKAQTRVKLEAAGLQGMFTCGNGDSTVAIEVLPAHREGTDPEAAPAEWRVDLYAVSGTQILWTAADGKEIEMAAPSHQTVGNPLSDERMPSWYGSASPGPIERRAAEVVEEKLRGVGPDRSTMLVLQELAQDRRKEVRSLAVRCLAVVGKYEPLVNTLDETEQRTAWPEHVEALRTAVARGPETSALVRKALSDLHGAKEAELFRMLWGYSDEQLLDGAADQLVDYLEHPDLDFRVLSYWNLKNITGKSLNYRPEYPEAKRKQGVQQFRLLASKGQITYPKKVEPKGAKPRPEAAVETPEAEGKE